MSLHSLFQMKTNIALELRNLLLGHSCKIGNIACPRDIENQNCQFCKIHTFSPILTFEYYTEAQKYIRQSYSSVNQHLWPIYEYDSPHISV